ncbi:hypothetical protein V6N12_028481 [Hibiscus sabdariffa]|uniref:RNase H type-1 domain-containing protein n=1 Tax=Hibiscus sabdariffa TaxID=183260 RepID=A0ABR2F5Y1_9ROSI
MTVKSKPSSTNFLCSSRATLSPPLCKPKLISMDSQMRETEYNVWKRRNDFVFNDECLPLPDIYQIGFVWASHFAATIPDVAMGSHAAIDSIHWVAPPHDWISLNTDAAVSSLNNFGTIGGVLCGPASAWLRGYCKSVGVVSPLNAEIWSILEGLNMAWSMGFSRVQVQSDSSVAIRMLLDPMAAN